MDPKAKADALLAQATLAGSNGNTPEQIEARQQVAKLFAQIHLKDESPLAPIDFNEPVKHVDGKSIQPPQPPSKGFFGFIKKKKNKDAAHIVSLNFPPKKPDDPIYALEYYPIESES